MSEVEVQTPKAIEQKVPSLPEVEVSASKEHSKSINKRINITSDEGSKNNSVFVHSSKYLNRSNLPQTGFDKVDRIISQFLTIIGVGLLVTFCRSLYSIKVRKD